MGEQLLKFWKWLLNAAQQAAIAEAPAVMTAAGQKINRNTGKVEYSHANDEGVKQLRSNLAAIGEAGMNAPGAAKAIELGYNVVRHPQQSYRAVKRAGLFAKKKIIKLAKSSYQLEPVQLLPPPQEVRIDIPDIALPRVPQYSDELLQAMDRVGYRHHYIVSPYDSEATVWERIRELEAGGRLVGLRTKVALPLSPRDLALRKARTDAGPESTYSLAYFNMSPRSAYERAMSDWQRIPVGSSFALIDDGALSTDSAPMVYGMMSRFKDEAELIPIMTDDGTQVMQSLNGLGNATGQSAIKRINMKIDNLNRTTGLNLPHSAIDPTSGEIMIPSVYAKRVKPVSIGGTDNVISSPADRIRPDGTQVIRVPILINGR